MHRGPLSELKTINDQMNIKISTNNKLNNNSVNKQDNIYHHISVKSKIDSMTTNEDNNIEQSSNNTKEEQNGGGGDPIITPIVPPKPLPRRTGSISEGCDDVGLPRPIARPRTTATPIVTSVNPSNYKVCKRTMNFAIYIVVVSAPQILEWF